MVYVAFSRNLPVTFKLTSMKTKLTLYLGLFAVFGCTSALAQPANDDVCNAQTISINSSVSGSCDLATTQPGEIFPPNTGMDCYTDWCDGTLDGSVWYKFIAPSSGNIIISSCSDNTYADTQFALYDVTDCSDFGSFSFLAINDDNPGGCSQGIGDYSSLVAYCGLISGETYYLQVDGFLGDPGPFEISVEDPMGCPLLAYVQFVHSSPDASVGMVDIRINGVLRADNLSYGEATPMLLINDITNAYWTVNPSNSSDDSNPYFGLQLSLPMLSSFVVPLIGINDVGNYDISETNALFGFTGIDVPVSPNNPNNEYIAFFNNVTDINGLRYLYDGIDAYGPVWYGQPIADEYPLSNHDFDVYATSNPAHYGRFSVPFDNYTGQSIAVITSGFVDPENNANGPGLSMWVVEQDGTVSQYPDLLSIEEVTPIAELSLYPNPANETTTIDYSIPADWQSAILELCNITGQVLKSQDISGTGTIDKIIFETSELSPGAYYVDIKCDGIRTVPQQLIVAH